MANPHVREIDRFTDIDGASVAVGTDYGCVTITTRFGAVLDEPLLTRLTDALARARREAARDAAERAALEDE